MTPFHLFHFSLSKGWTSTSWLTIMPVTSQNTVHKQHMKIKFGEIEDAFQYANMGSDYENSAILNKETGEIYYQSDFGDSDELPEDIDNDKYIELPDKNELNLGKRLVIQFVREFIPKKLDKVEEIFSRKGANAKYKDLLGYEEKLNEWYAFENEAQTKALKQWCEDNDIAIDKSGQVRNRNPG